MTLVPLGIGLQQSHMCAVLTVTLSSIMTIDDVVDPSGRQPTNREVKNDNTDDWRSCP